MDAETYQYFRLEAGELHERLSTGALSLERERDAKLVAQLLRHAHTLKGAANVVREIAIAERAHAIEGVLMPFRESGAAGRESIESVLAHLDAIARAFRELDATMGAAAQPSERTDETGGDGRIRIIRSDAREIDQLIEGIGEAAASIEGIGARADDFIHLRRLIDLLASQLMPTASTQRLEESANWQRARSLLDEMKSLGARLQVGVLERAEQAGQGVRRAREVTEQLRLVSADILFTPLERIVRDGSRATGSTVELRTSGGDIRLDAEVLGVMQTALVQLVRNAVAHGIEKPEERQRSGKPVHGTISIEVERLGSGVAFRCRDDGRGIDRDGIRRRAGARTPSGTADKLSDQDLLELMLESRVSTSSSVTQHAGRGVGMDVVREASARLGGTVRLVSTGSGTLFEIVVPASLSAIEAVLVEAGGMNLAFPLTGVGSILRVDASEIVAGQGQEAIVDAGASIPLLRVDTALGAARADGSLTAIVMTLRGGRVAFGVSQVQENARVVLRPVPRVAPVARYVSGVAVDANGALRYAIDPELLVEA